MRDAKGRRMHHWNIKQILGLESGDKDPEAPDFDHLEVREWTPPDKDDNVGGEAFISKFMREDGSVVVEPTQVKGRAYQDPKNLLTKYQQAGRGDIQPIKQAIRHEAQPRPFSQETEEAPDLDDIPARKLDPPPPRARDKRVPPPPPDWDSRNVQRPEIPEDWSDKDHPAKRRRRFAGGKGFTVGDDGTFIVDDSDN